MRVLVVHNRYRAHLPSGENVVVAEEIEALRSRGVAVREYMRSSDEIASFGTWARLTLPLRPIYSYEDVRAIAELLRVERPDILHLHNPFPLISPGVIKVAKRNGIPVVQTVHNHRHVCLNGAYFRAGRECRDCLGDRLPWRGVVHGCYRGSRPESLLIAASIVAHRPTFATVDRFLALTPQIAAHLVAAGVASERITVRPNTLRDPGDTIHHEGKGFVWVGRLQAEKGIKLLLDAWCRHPDSSLGTLTIVGGGPESARVQATVNARANVLSLGQQDSS